MVPRCSFRLAVAFCLSVAASPAFARDGGSESGVNKRNLDLPYEAESSTEEEEEAPEIVVFYGQQYEGDGIFFCCDKSGSMNEAAKFRKLQQEVIKNLTQFSERVQFGIVFFDANVYKFPSSSQPATATASLKTAGLAFVMSTSPGKGTCLKPALIQCLNYANQSSAKRKVIIYLSDGFATCPGFDPPTYAKEALNEVTQRNTSRAHINTICIGPPGAVDENFMRALASQNGGSMARVQ